MNVNRKKLQLDAVVGERAAAASRCTSSEDSALSSGDTDTASAGSSPRAHSQAPAPAAQPQQGPRTDAVAPRRHRRDEYDSSATETADEENDAPTTKVHTHTRAHTNTHTHLPPSIAFLGRHEIKLSYGISLKNCIACPLEPSFNIRTNFGQNTKKLNELIKYCKSI